MVFKVQESFGLNGTLGWKWTLHGKDGPLCQSVFPYPRSEAECRSRIASVKTAMKGARFAKVEVVK